MREPWSEAGGRIGVALSGGGHRATLFSLGVLLYLSEAGLGPAVTVISSVSGGSITNGFVAQECNFNSTSRDEFRNVASRLARVIAYRGTLFASWLTLLYVGLLVAAVALAVVALFVLSGITRIVVVAALFLLLGVSIGYRGAIASYAFGRVLFTTGVKRTRLEDIQTGPDHIFCATDLLAGEPFFFSRSFVYSYSLGWGTTSRLKLQTAVQASAALPGAFPPARLRTSQLDFVRSRPTAGESAVPEVYLVDGGVYNNLGTEWIEGLRERTKRQRPLELELQQADFMVVVNSSGRRRGRKSSRNLSLPYLRDVQAIPLVTDVLYANTIAPRLRALSEQSIQLADKTAELRPAVIQIDRSPMEFARPRSSLGGPVGERASRLVAVLEGLRAEGDEYDEYWREYAAVVSSVATTLSKVGEHAAARIIHHGYISAMTVLHITFGWPLVDPVPGDEFAFALLRA